jgi:sugar phosphate isomerase/epimerase
LLALRAQQLRAQQLIEGEWMPRPILLFSGPFSDLPLAELAPKAAEWGYGGLELCTWGDHLEVQRALSDSEPASNRLSLLAAHDLQAPVVSAHQVGQCVSDPIDGRHKALVPDYVWGDGQPEGVRTRAAEELIATIRVAQQIGASVVSGFLGSPIWSYVCGYPNPGAATIDAGFAEFARRVHPILDACREAGVRFALEVHPGQIAFDLYSAERTLEAVEHRDEFGFTFDPSHFHWQGVEPAEFVRHFPDRILHVHVKDIVLQLGGRSSVLNSHFPYGDSRRGWEFRTPGRGGLTWESIIRALNEIGYDGPLSVDWRDPGMDRDFAAAEACEFVRSLDFPAPQSLRSRNAFRDV